MFYLMQVPLVIGILLILMKPFTMCSKIVRALHQRLYKMTFFSMIFRGIIENYLIFCIISFINVDRMLFNYSGEIVSSILTIGFCGTLVIFPLASFCFLVRNRKNLDEQQFMDKYETLYEGLKTEKSSILAYNFLFLARRFTFAILIIIVNEPVI